MATDGQSLTPQQGLQTSSLNSVDWTTYQPMPLTTLLNARFDDVDFNASAATVGAEIHMDTAESSNVEVEDASQILEQAFMSVMNAGGPGTSPDFGANSYNATATGFVMPNQQFYTTFSNVSNATMTQLDGADANAVHDGNSNMMSYQTLETLLSSQPYLPYAFTPPNVVPTQQTPFYASNGLQHQQSMPTTSFGLSPPPTKSRRQFYLSDYVAVIGIDHREYYGQIQSFFTLNGMELLQEDKMDQEDDEGKDDRFFCMKWLVPDREAFERAAREGRDYLPGDFSDVPTSHITAESLSSINRVFYSPKLIAAAASISSPSNFPAVYVTSGSNPRSPPQLTWRDESSLGHYGGTKRILDEYDQTDTGKLYRYITLLCKTHIHNFIHHPPTHLRPYMPSLSPVHLLSILVNHFLLPPSLPLRIDLFMRSVMTVTKFLGPDRFGWSRIGEDEGVFGIRRGVLMAHVLGDMVEVNNSMPVSGATGKTEDGEEVERLVDMLEEVLDDVLDQGPKRRGRVGLKDNGGRNGKFAFMTSFETQGSAVTSSIRSTGHSAGETIEGSATVGAAFSSSSSGLFPFANTHHVNMPATTSTALNPVSTPPPPTHSLIPPSLWPMIFHPTLIPTPQQGVSIQNHEWSPTNPAAAPLYLSIEILTSRVVHALMGDYIGSVLNQTCERTGRRGAGGVAPFGGLRQGHDGFGGGVREREAINKQLVFRWVETKVGEEVKRRWGGVGDGY
ncbi:hypothetical protein HDU97_006014 [Phlyctochytrium planicorne]|nr:hypothetical protein HDU97_006014 [Phlyctochytrium planicorne]